MEWIDYFNLLILIHLILQTSFGTFILFKTCQILRLKQLFKKATPTMLLYFFFISVLTFTLAIYSIFAIIFWRPDKVLADQTALYIIGFIPWILICINPVCEFCLCLERILTISFPYQYLERPRKLMGIFTFVFLTFSLLFNIFMNEMTKMPKFSEPRCRFFTCFTLFMSKPFLNPFKICISILEGFAAIFLFFLIKYKTLASGHSKHKFRNTAMLIIISTTIILEFTPNLIDLLFGLIFEDISLVTYLGPYRTPISCISIMINILLYSKVFAKSNKKIIIVHVTPSTAFSK